MSTTLEYRADQWNTLLLGILIYELKDKSLLKFPGMLHLGYVVPFSELPIIFETFLVGTRESETAPDFSKVCHPQIVYKFSEQILK